jgi:hypothetical protein
MRDLPERGAASRAPISMYGGSPNPTALPVGGAGQLAAPGSMSLTRASESARVAACTTATPFTEPHGTGPLTVKPEMRTCAPWPIRTIAVGGIPLRRFTA